MKRPSLLVPAALLLTACIAVPEEAGFSDVQRMTAERLEARIHWLRGASEEARARDEVERLLAGPLSADAAVQIALLENRSLQASYERLGIAQADVVQAGLLHNPVFSGNARFPAGSASGTNLELAVVQDFLDVLLLPSRKEAAETRFAAEKLSVAADVVAFATRVREAYFSALGAEQVAAVRRLVVDAAMASTELARRVHEAGNLSDLDLAGEIGLYEDARVAWARAEAERRRAREDLTRLMGLWGRRAAWELPPSLPVIPPEEIALEGLEAAAIESRLDLAALRKQSEAIARSLGITRDWRFLASSELGISAERDTDGQWVTGPELRLALPIFDQGQARLARRAAELRRADQRVIALAVEIRSEVRSTRDRLLALRRLGEHYREVLIPLREAMVALTQQEYDYMLTGAFELIVAKQAEYDAYQEYTEVVRDYWSRAPAWSEPSVVACARVSGRQRPGRTRDGARTSPTRRAVGTRCTRSTEVLDMMSRRELVISTGSAALASRCLGTAGPPRRRAGGSLPVVTPNGRSLPWVLKEGVKEFHLVAQPVEREFAPGMVVKCWGYNGETPGPTIECDEGDRVRILVTNELPEHTTVHWHGIFVPNGMDGVGGLNQPQIAPGETWAYEFTLRQHGTFLYHPHADEMLQMAVGMMGLFVVHPAQPEDPPVDRDFAILLHEWAVHPGTYRPDPSIMLDFNLFTFNGKVFPAIDPLVVRTGQRVRVRFGNLSMDQHPIHLHGYAFEVTATDGGPIPPAARWPMTTVPVPVGSTRDIQWLADAPGDWAFHCHKSHHTMNAMGHGIPNMLGVSQGSKEGPSLEARIRALLPGYMPMGESGMAGHAAHAERMQGPRNTLPMMTGQGPHGRIEMGGMFTVVKVRDGIDDYRDPGWYEQPEGSAAYRVH